MLADAYDLSGQASLQRLRPELATAFEAAFVAAEADLREWMPSAAREQEDAVAFLEWCDGAFAGAEVFAYGIVAPDGELGGYLSLRPEARHAVVGYWVRPEWRGRGIAPLALRVLSDAAFAALGDIDRIHAHLDAANGASRRVLEKAGFHVAETVGRPPRTASESDTEWVYVRDRGR